MSGYRSELPPHWPPSTTDPQRETPYVLSAGIEIKANRKDGADMLIQETTTTQQRRQDVTLTHLHAYCVDFRKQATPSCYRQYPVNGDMEPGGQDINLNSPNKGLLTDYGADVPVLPAGGHAPADAAGMAVPEGLTEAETEELHSELLKVEEEINTLRQVLAAKERHAAELKRKLGQTPLNQLKMNLSKSLQEVQMSNAYKKTQETLSQAGQKTSAALSNVGTAITRRLGDMRALPFSQSFSSYSIRHSISMPAMRNSPTFKSFEERVGSLKGRVSLGGGESGNFHSPDNNPQDSAPF
ncbi:tumor protein D54 isoform X4 [Xenopus tropicalis]|uniref:Tumor protein D54 isoform X4 n=1 Tax=Xenopus tropicalis TaxID=8364 RepID=A0A8J1IZT9_XENTR|nr:tumor protein D54 isoform X4 [Xenopus tropicalis]